MKVDDFRWARLSPCSTLTHSRRWSCLYPSAVFTPVAKVGIHGWPRRKVTWQSPPTAALTQDVENGVEDVPHIREGRPPGLGSGIKSLSNSNGLEWVARVSFTHVALKGAVYYLFAAYTGRAFYYDRLLKHPLRYCIKLQLFNFIDHRSS